MGQREGALYFPVPAALGLAGMAVSSHAQTKRSRSAWEIELSDHGEPDHIDKSLL